LLAVQDETAWREEMFQKYVGEVTKLTTEFSKTGWNPKYLEHLQKQFMAAPIAEIQKRMDDLPNDLRMQRADYENQARIEKWEQERKSKALETARNTYDLADGTYQRVVCSSGDPGFDKTGMPAYDDDLYEHDPELKGYSGVHVGSPRQWLPVLERDGYCGADAYIYDIYAEEMAETETPLYVMEDYHVRDRTFTPDSEIIFGRLKVFPAEIIELKKVIPFDKIKPAPDLY
jgi:hypothetical protein